jgi:hypothetical protein
MIATINGDDLNVEVIDPDASRSQQPSTGRPFAAGSVLCVLHILE